MTRWHPGRGSAEVRPVGAKAPDVAVRVTRSPVPRWSAARIERAVGMVGARSDRLLLSTSDTDLITARASGARYRWANPSRLVDGELEELLDGADLVVVRILGGYRAWQDGIDTVVASGVPTVVVSGEQAPDAELMSHSTTRRASPLQAHIYLAQGGVDNLAPAARIPLRHRADDRIRVRTAGRRTPNWGVLDASVGNRRRPDDRRALLPRPAAGGQHRLRRGAVQRNRRRRRAARCRCTAPRCAPPSPRCSSCCGRPTRW